MIGRLFLVTSLITSLTLFWLPAVGASNFPEFRSLTEEEELSFDNPSRLDPEYQSDVLTYSVPFRWAYDFWANPQGLLTSVGSTSENEFGVVSQAKIQKWLTEDLEFRWTFTDERNRDDQAVHAVLELIWWPMSDKFVGVSLYGEPGYHKRTNDVGLAAVFKPTPYHEIRLFQTFVDITRPQRNDESDTFEGQHLPYAQGIVGRSWSALDSNESEFLQYALVLETPTEWLFPDNFYKYFYSRDFLQVLGRKKGEQSYWNYLNEFTKKGESREPSGSGSTVAPDSLISYRWESRLEWEKPLTGLWLEIVRPGVQWVYREWQGANDLEAKQSELLPYLWVRIPGWERGANHDFWEAGYEFTWYRASGDQELKSNIDLDGRLEQRFNLSYDFVFGTHSQLRILGSADLDKLFSDFNGLFEGGLAQFRTTF